MPWTHLHVTGTPACKQVQELLTWSCDSGLDGPCVVVGGPAAAAPSQRPGASPPRHSASPAQSAALTSDWDVAVLSAVPSPVATPTPPASGRVPPAAATSWLAWPLPTLWQSRALLAAATSLALGRAFAAAASAGASPASSLANDSPVLVMPPAPTDAADAVRLPPPMLPMYARAADVRRAQAKGTDEGSGQESR